MAAFTGRWIWSRPGPISVWGKRPRVVAAAGDDDAYASRMKRVQSMRGANTQKSVTRLTKRKCDRVHDAGPARPGHCGGKVQNRMLTVEPDYLSSAPMS